jgi:hypothetical protein
MRTTLTRPPAVDTTARYTASKSFSAILNTHTGEYRLARPSDGEGRSLVPPDVAENVSSGDAYFGYNGLVQQMPELFTLEDG